MDVVEGLPKWVAGLALIPRVKAVTTDITTDITDNITAFITFPITAVATEAYHQNTT